MIQCFNEFNGTGKKMAVVVVSGDKTQEEFFKTFSQTPFLSVPWEDHAKARSAYPIKCWPFIYVMKPDGTVVTPNSGEVKPHHAVRSK
jgi:hypothetical protein